eukprot:Phypoly_transcript_17101.p1 GENE.Phypoly_transcript_17101~~Phypoly_transcript_17101.p1  ORF type:complete len:148 (-),score=14.24 Phypoly_transcript_17101:231-674(-)
MNTGNSTKKKRLQTKRVLFAEGISKLMHEFKATQLHNLRSINTTGKFIIYQAPDGTGLGNRIPPLISAALLALVVGRGLMVHWLQEDVTSNSQLELMAMVPFKDLFEPPFVMDTTSVPQLYQLITTANTVRFTCFFLFVCLFVCSYL